MGRARDGGDGVAVTGRGGGAGDRVDPVGVPCPAIEGEDEAVFGGAAPGAEMGAQGGAVVVGLPECLMQPSRASR